MGNRCRYGGGLAEETELPDTPDYSLLDRAGVAASMFYPRAETYPPPDGATDLAIEVEPGVHVGARFYAFEREFPTVLYFHGNGEIASDHDDIALFYREIGLNLFVAEFRGYGTSNGTPTVASLIGDAHPVAQQFDAILDRLDYAPERFVMGRSLGAHPALEIAANKSERFRGLVIESGAGNIRRMLERTGLLDTELGGLLAATHESKVRSIAIPALLIHGEQDELVPLSTAHALSELLEHSRHRLVTIPGAGHNDLLWIGREQYFEAIRAFVAEALAS